MAKRHIAEPRPSAVLVIDLDQFKSINDRFGHALGDRVLEIFTETTRRSIRTTDLIGRLGGEEFAAVLLDTSHDRAAMVAERIREGFAQAALEVESRPVCATVSIGLVHCKDAVLDVPQLLAQADQALYFAKERGRNRVEIASLDLALQSAGSQPVEPRFKRAAKSAAA
jgi:diguanylate cyclase (GGDEF)-like protein